MSMLKSVIIGGMIASSLMFQPPAQAAGETMGLTCLGTKTGYAVTFRYRWGESDSWSDLISVSPGEWHWIKHDYDYPGQNSSPLLQIMFDQDATAGVSYTIYNLKAYAAFSQDCEGQGKTYYFYQRGNQIRVEDGGD